MAKGRPAEPASHPRAAGALLSSALPMLNYRAMRKDDLKFLAALAATVVLGAFLVYSAYLKDERAATGPTVDVKKIELLRDRGTITLRDADYWEPAEEGR